MKSDGTNEKQDEKLKSKSDEKSKNIHEGHRERLRNKYIHNGLSAFEDHEALEFLLFYCLPRKNTNELAHNLIAKYGSLHGLFEATPQDISKNCNVSLNIAVLISLVAPLSKRYISSKWNKKVILDSSKKSSEYAKTLFTGETTECFYIICLDNQRGLIHPELLSRGTIDEAQIYPREVVRAALKHNAASVIIAHNHPSGLMSASRSDIDATIRVINALAQVEIDVVDHIIVAGENSMSFSEKKLLKLEY